VEQPRAGLLVHLHGTAHSPAHLRALFLVRTNPRVPYQTFPLLSLFPRNALPLSLDLPVQRPHDVIMLAVRDGVGGPELPVELDGTQIVLVLTEPVVLGLQF